MRMFESEGVDMMELGKEIDCMKSHAAGVYLSNST